MLIEALKVIKPSDIYKYPWVGEVVDNNDPKKLRRVKVVIKGLLEGSKDALPWVSFDGPSDAGGTGSDGSFIVPKVGSKLNIHFPYDDLHFPFYRGYHQSNETRLSEFDSDYPNNFGFQAGETKIVVNRETAVVEISTKNGVKLKITEAGDITVEGPTKIEVKSPEITFNKKMSGITTAQSHFNVVDFITGIEVIPSQTTFGDI